ncbi:MAG TPA: TonB-dependent receptor, partial [Povalibacter sp.]|nr:TonB-dependent receptor [Povalibacter sp.]
AAKTTSLKSALTAILQRGAPALAICALATEHQAYAQEVAGSSNVEEVVVTGIRQSLESSQDIKKDAAVFVDSVTAEDIGALPDRSVTEVLQRIPGVAINRFAGSNDPDHFSIEGSGVVVRGLNQVRSELNGRDTFSANNGRFLSFADVPPELMSGVDVFKNQSADMIEGGLAGTVNLRTRVPFDSAGQTIAFSAEGNYGDFAKEWSPTASALYANRWNTGIGDVGILVNGVYSQLKSRSDGAQASSFQQRPGRVAGDPSADDLWFPSGAAFRTQDYDRKRIGSAFAGQWQSNDETMLATLQYLRSDARTEWTEHAVEIATDVVEQQSRASFPQNGTTFEHNADDIFTDGLITAQTGWRSDQNGADPRTPVYGLQSNNIARGQNDHFITSDYSLNFKWRPNEQWSVNFDAQHVDSTVEVLSMTMWGTTFQNVGLDLSQGIPRITFFGPSVGGTVQNCTPPTGACPSYFNGAHNSFTDPYNSFWRAAMDHAEDSEGQEDAYKLDIERSFEDAGWLNGIKFGARLAEREQTTRYTTYNWGALSEIWGNNGPVWFTDPADGTPGGTGGQPAGLNTQLFGFENFMRGKVPVPVVLPFYTGDLTSRAGYNAMAADALRIGGEWVANTGGSNSWEPLADPRRGAHIADGSYFLPNEVNVTDEKTDALYAMLKFGNNKSGAGSVSGNVGVRWVRTNFSADGTIGYPTPGSLTSEADCLSPPNGGAPSAFCQIPAEERARARRFATGGSSPTTAETTYEDWLPSLNLKVNVTDELLFRFGYSQAMARPDLGLTRAFYNMSPYVPVVNGVSVWSGFQVANGGTGNPNLKPTRSTQFDASVEWYFAPVGSLTVSLFHKRLKDVLTNGIGLVPITNNGETYDVYTVSPVNSTEDGTVKGFEVGYQQFYDFLPGIWSGFGVNTNYTYIDSKGVPQSTLNNTSGTPASTEANVDTSLLPLQGLSKDNFNFTLMYEKGPVSARVGYSWRSRFLLTTRDVITPFAPIFNEDTGQVDASFMYTINDHIKVGFQGVNLSNEITKTTQVLNDDLLTAGRSWFMNDRRYSLIARMTF